MPRARGNGAAGSIFCESLWDPAECNSAAGLIRLTALLAILYPWSSIHLAQAIDDRDN
jgi:hypothetical protein